MPKKRKLAVAKPSVSDQLEINGKPIESVTKPFVLHNRLSLSEHSPEVAKQWHSALNGGFEPDQFSYGSSVNVWWICDKGPDHTWRQTISTRAAQRKGCPYCAGQKVSITNSLQSLRPEIAQSWHPTKNKASASDVTASASYEAWWLCEKNHTWKAVINHRTSGGSGCPKCHIQKTTGLRRFPEYLKYFDHERNAGTNPKKLSVGTVVFWKCPNASDHLWQSIFTKTHAIEACPFCRGYRASSTNNLTLENSLINEFHPVLNENLSPTELTLGSRKKIFWLCQKCAYTWQARVSDRTYKKYGCLKCSRSGRSRAKVPG